MQIKIERLLNRLNQINAIGRLDNGGVNRPALSDADKDARDLLIKWMKELDLEIQIDEIGNIFGIWNGEKEQCIGTGSHLDTVPTGGKFDGTLGVIAALEVIETLKERQFRPQHSIVVANFTNEEGVRFTPDMMGSAAYANPELLPALLLSKALDNERSVLDELQRIGYAGTMKCGALPFQYFIELHIEQGPMLERENVDIGIVSGVQAIVWQRITIEGKSAHAGTTPIDFRKDALNAFSYLSVYARELCEMEEGLLITIGMLTVSPGSINVVPNKVVATVDLRHADNSVAMKYKNLLHKFTASHKSFLQLKVTWESLVDISSRQFSPTIVQGISESCQTLSYSSKSMISGAGHDAQLLSTRYPSGMIFIPSKDGISHAFDEYSSPLQIEKGVNVLLHVIVRLDDH